MNKVVKPNHPVRLPQSRAGSDSTIAAVVDMYTSYVENVKDTKLKGNSSTVQGAPVDARQFGKVVSFNSLQEFHASMKKKTDCKILVWMTMPVCLLVHTEIS